MIVCIMTQPNDVTEPGYQHNIMLSVAIKHIILCIIMMHVFLQSVPILCVNMLSVAALIFFFFFDRVQSGRGQRRSLLSFFKLQSFV
jgi:hypothetical protein